MRKRKLDLLTTMRDVLVTGVIVIIYMQMNVQAIRNKRIYLWSSKGSFRSPNYPGPYPAGLYYQWFMPYTSKELRLEFVELDLYNCFVKKRDQDCNDFDYVHIKFTDHHDNDNYYCNWNIPTKPITFLPWTHATIIFYSSYLSSDCKGRGFKVKYRPVDQWNETSTRWSTTTTMTTTTTGTSSEWSGAAPRNGNQSLSFPMIFLLVAVPIPFILVIVCLYCWCRTRRRSPPVNQDVLQTAINNWNYQTGIPVTHTEGTDRVPNTYQDVRFLTVDMPPLHRTGSSDGIAQTRRPITARGRYSDQSQTYDNELPETVGHDPPPSYDEVWESDDLNRSQSFEPPPSYEAVLRESYPSLDGIDQGTRNVDITERYNNDIQGNVRTLNHESSTSNEANSGRRTFEINI